MDKLSVLGKQNAANSALLSSKEAQMQANVRIKLHVQRAAQEVIVRVSDMPGGLPFLPPTSALKGPFSEVQRSVKSYLSSHCPCLQQALH